MIYDANWDVVQDGRLVKTLQGAIALIASLEGTLRLHRHEAGSLTRMSKFLHQRTGGMIGSLSHLVRAAAISAILDGTECITRTIVKNIRIDHSSESSAGRYSAPARSTG
jgi:hypothetical protein